MLLIGIFSGFIAYFVNFPRFFFFFFNNFLVFVIFTGKPTKKVKVKL